MNKALIGRKLSDKELNYSTKKEKNRVLPTTNQTNTLFTTNPQGISLFIYNISLSVNQSKFKKRGMIMQEFAKMIYLQWRRENEERDVYFKKGEEFNAQLEDILSVKILNDIYDLYCDSCIEIEESAFIAGFAYACKCLSNGKIEIGGGK